MAALMRCQAADTGGPLVQRARVPCFPRRQITVFGEKIGVSVTRAFKWPAGEMAFDTFERTTTVSQSHAGAMTKAVNFDIFFLDDGREGIVGLPE